METVGGFVGAVARKGCRVDRAQLRALTRALTYRAPDGSSFECEASWGFGFARIETVPAVRSARQPVTNRGELWVVADVRLDERGSLLRELGLPPGKESRDVDLVLLAYRKWAERCPEHLMGDFAFAVWDRPRQRLFAARDRFGVKPFYYAKTESCLLVSNTLRCLRRHPEIGNQPREAAIGDFLLFEFNRDPATTAFRDIERIPPAHSMIWERDQMTLHRYWRLQQVPQLRYRRPETCHRSFLKAMRSAVAARMEGGTASVFMSGGLDSTAVASVASEVSGVRRGVAAVTYHYETWFPDEELEYARKAADFLDIPLLPLPAEEYPLVQAGADEALYPPEPSVIHGRPMHLAAYRLAASHSRVALTGDGGDPLLGASSTYLEDELRSFRLDHVAHDMILAAWCLRTVPRPGLRPALRGLLRGPADPAEPTAPYPGWIEPAIEQRLHLRERWRELPRPSRANRGSRWESYADIDSAGWAAYFEAFDAGATGRPVETRYPFFDLRVVRFLLSLPPWPWCVDKMLLRHALRGRLPDTVRLRPKALLGGDPVRTAPRAPGDSLLGVPPHERLSDYVRREAAGDGNQVPTRARHRIAGLNLWLHGLDRAR